MSEYQPSREDIFQVMRDYGELLRVGTTLFFRVPQKYDPSYCPPLELYRGIIVPRWELEEQVHIVVTPELLQEFRAQDRTQ